MDIWWFILLIITAYIGIAAVAWLREYRDAILSKRTELPIATVRSPDGTPVEFVIIYQVDKNKVTKLLVKRKRKWWRKQEEVIAKVERVTIPTRYNPPHRPKP